MNSKRTPPHGSQQTLIRPNIESLLTIRRKVKFSYDQVRKKDQTLSAKNKLIFLIPGEQKPINLTVRIHVCQAL